MCDIKCISCGERFYNPGITYIGNKPYCSVCALKHKQQERQKIAKFINTFKESQKNIDLEHIFLHGWCYYFVLILDDLFDGTIYYHSTTSHFAFMHHKRLYDITGVISSEGFEEWANYKHDDPAWTQRIIKNIAYMEDC